MARTRGNSGREPARGSAAGARDEAPASSSNGVPDLLRRALTLGLSSFFTTNEAVRRAVGEAVPKDWIDFAVDQSERTRAEFVERLAGEIARTLESIDLAAIAERVLAGHTIDVKAQIKLLPRDSETPAEPFRISVLGEKGSE
jgi:hypothetical protein